MSASLPRRATVDGWPGETRIRRFAALAASITLVGTILSSCAPGATPPAVGGDPSNDPAWLTAVRNDAGVYDEFGRRAVLRGVNLNHLGDYFVSDPRLPTTSPLTEDDWDDPRRKA